MQILILTAVLLAAFISPSISWGLDAKYLKALMLQELKQEAPDFTVVGADGQRMSLKDLRGRVVILHIWATWCKPCREEFPLFEKMHQNLKGKDVVFLPVAIDTKATREEVAAHAKGMGAGFPVYLARAGNITDRYWAWGTPVTYFIDKRGWIAARAIGPRDWGAESVKELVRSLLE